jgi:ATP adenylyltransferase
MKILWAPWRRKYVTSSAPEPGCVFCRAVERASDPGSLVVHLAPLSLIVMNLYPYNGGHVMIAPRRHVGRLGELKSEELAEMALLAQRLVNVVEEVYKPQGLNLGMNLGRAAGAGIEDHLHLHVVPRWNGDTNFISVVGQTRVIPEDLREACLRLRGFFEDSLS